MPWSVKRDSRCPVGKPFAVVVDATGKLAGCHPTRERARAQQAALYASEATKGIGYAPKAFRSEQPRWPQGHPAGGKWRSKPTAEDLKLAQVAMREMFSHLRAAGGIDPETLAELEDKIGALFSDLLSQGDVND